MSHENPGLISPPAPDPHQAIQPDSPDFRETPEIEPFSDVREHFPIWLYLVCGAALFLAGSSFTGFQVFGRHLLDEGPGAPVLTASGPQPEAASTPADIGRKVYGQTCANCHVGTGMGQPGTYPPLAGSEWVQGSKLRLAAILLKGLQGPVTVKGATFPGVAVMPAQETVLSPEKIADLMTYIRGNSDWGNTANAVTADEVNAAKAKFAAQAQPFTEAALLAIAPHGRDPSDKK